jgi:hypothetical protein
MSEEEETHEQQARLSETEAFLKVFTSKHGPEYKLCPKEWLITDWGFGVDITCCQGDCHPLSIRDIRKMSHGSSDRECFMNWARLIGKASDHTLDEIPQVNERVKIRQVIRQQRVLSQKLDDLSSKQRDPQDLADLKSELNTQVLNKLADFESRISK